MSTPSRPHKPSLRGSWSDALGADARADPARRLDLAHTTAAAVLRRGREGPGEPPLDLVERVGLDELAELWREAEPATLPGALYRLYLLRTWCRRSGVETARLYAAGRTYAEVADAVAGVATPPGPQEVARLADAVLTSAYRGDLAVALERAAAFCRVVAAGRLEEAEHGRLEERDAQYRLAAGNARAADQLDAAARAHRAGELA